MTTIKLRRGTTSQWQSANPVLAYGEPGWDRDARIFKIGDGISTWSNLEGITGEATPGGEPVPNGDAVSTLFARTDENADEGPLWRTDFTGTLSTNFSNLQEHWIGSKLAAWLNEWGALRGRSPYSTFGDALVRAIIEAGDFVSNGNFIELVDRRLPEGPARQLWGRRWSDGTLIRNGMPFVDVYYHAGSTETIPWADLPTPCVIVTSESLTGDGPVLG